MSVGYHLRSSELRTALLDRHLRVGDSWREPQVLLANQKKLAPGDKVQYPVLEILQAAWYLARLPKNRELADMATRRAGAPTVDEETLSRALGSRITSLQDTIRVEHALRTVMIASLEAVNVAPPAATAPVSALSAAPAPAAQS